MEPTAVAVESAEQVHWLIKAFHDGGNAMIMIAFVGVLTFILIIERMFQMKKLVIDKDDFTEKIYTMLLRGDLRQAISFCDTKPAPLSNTVKAGLIQVLNKRPDEEVQVAMDGAVLRETPRIEGWTSFLAVFGNVATLVGLLGTIIGLIGGFAAVAEADAAAKAAMLSKAIAHALNCTAAGLIVAVPALLAFGFYQIRIGRAINEMQETSMTIMNLVASNRDKMKA